MLLDRLLPDLDAVGRHDPRHRRQRGRARRRPRAASSATGRCASCPPGRGATSGPRSPSATRSPREIRKMVTLRAVEPRDGPLPGLARPVVCRNVLMYLTDDLRAAVGGAPRRGAGPGRLARAQPARLRPELEAAAGAGARVRRPAAAPPRRRAASGAAARAARPASGGAERPAARDAPASARPRRARPPRAPASARDRARAAADRATRTTRSRSACRRCATTRSTPRRTC